MREDARRLGNHGNAAPPRRHEGGGVVDEALADLRATGVEPQSPGDNLGERGLASTVMPDDGRHEAWAQTRVHVPAALTHRPGDVDSGGRSVVTGITDAGFSVSRQRSLGACARGNPGRKTAPRPRR